MAELIISDVRPRVQYTADGVQTSFPYPFPIFDQADLVVVFDDNGAPGAHNITGAGVTGGGNVDFDSPPPLATRITIYRDMAFARETDFQEAGDFRAAVINEELDRMAMLLQQAEMLVADSLHKPLYDSEPDLLLPSAAARAGKVLAFDDDGLPTIGTPSEEAATLAALSATAAAASASSALSAVSYAINTAVPVQQLSGDGAALAFTLDRTVVDSTSIAISIDGVKQHTATYTAGGTTLTFTGAPPTGTDNVEVTFIGATGLTSNLGGGAFGGTRNRLINGNFAVNQRAVSGTVVLAAGEYGHDRFKAGSSGCTFTFAKSANVTTLTISAGSLQQVIEGGNLFAETMVLSWAGTAQGKIGAGSYAASGVSAAITGGANLTIEFNTGTLRLVQFEVGGVATPFEHRAGEMALCQRYFQRLNANGDRIPGQATGTTTASLLWPFTVEMRAAPTFALVTNGDVLRNVSSTEPVTGLSSSNIGTKHMVFNITVAANLSAGDATAYIPGDITADAEL